MPGVVRLTATSRVCTATDGTRLRQFWMRRTQVPRRLPSTEGGSLGWGAGFQVLRDFQPMGRPAPALGFAAIRPSLPFSPQRREPSRALQSPAPLGRERARRQRLPPAPEIEAIGHASPPPAIARAGCAPSWWRHDYNPAGCIAEIAHGQPEGPPSDRPLLGTEQYALPAGVHASGGARRDDPPA